MGFIAQRGSEHLAAYSLSRSVAGAAHQLGTLALAVWVVAVLYRRLVASSSTTDGGGPYRTAG